MRNKMRNKIYLDAIVKSRLLYGVEIWEQGEIIQRILTAQNGNKNCKIYTHICGNIKWMKQIYNIL